METFEARQTEWTGLWWHPEYNGFSSAAVNLAELKKFKGNVRILMRKNRFFNNGENHRPNYLLCIKSASSPTFKTLTITEDEDAVDDEPRLYTEEEVKRVMIGACEDGRRGLDPYDLLISDYIKED